MVSAPTSTKTMEITMATMGRLIKNFDIGLLSLRQRAKRLGVHLHTRAYFLHTFGNHVLATLQSVRNHPLVADSIADRDRSNAHFVVVTHNCHLIAALQFRNGALRYK